MTVDNFSIVIYFYLYWVFLFLPKFMTLAGDPSYPLGESYCTRIVACHKIFHINEQADQQNNRHTNMLMFSLI